MGSTSWRVQNIIMKYMTAEYNEYCLNVMKCLQQKRLFNILSIYF